MADAFVLDDSVVMRWCFEDGDTDYADGILRRLRDGEAVAPSVWPLEVANGLVVAERRKLLTTAQSTRFLQLLRALPIRVVHETPQRALGEVLALGRQHALSSYDASYLDLAMREGLALATLDGPLRAAARACQVEIVDG